jgi:hypothetical protein
LETSNWTVGAALAGWLGCDGLAEDRLVAFAVDPASFIEISFVFVMDGTGIDRNGHIPYTSYASYQEM